MAPTDRTDDSPIAGRDLLVKNGAVWTKEGEMAARAVANVERLASGALVGVVAWGQ